MIIIQLPLKLSNEGKLEWPDTSESESTPETRAVFAAVLTKAIHPDLTEWITRELLKQFHVHEGGTGMQGKVKEYVFAQAVDQAIRKALCLE